MVGSDSRTISVRARESWLACTLGSWGFGTLAGLRACVRLVLIFGSAKLDEYANNESLAPAATTTTTTTNAASPSLLWYIDASSSIHLSIATPGYSQSRRPGSGINPNPGLNAMKFNTAFQYEGALGAGSVQAESSKIAASRDMWMDGWGIWDMGYGCGWMGT